MAPKIIITWSPTILMPGQDGPLRWTQPAAGPLPAGPGVFVRVALDNELDKMKEQLFLNIVKEMALQLPHLLLVKWMRKWIGIDVVMLMEAGARMMAIGKAGGKMASSGGTQRLLKPPMLLKKMTMTGVIGRFKRKNLHQNQQVVVMHSLDQMHSLDKNKEKLQDKMMLQ